MTNNTPTDNQVLPPQEKTNEAPPETPKAALKKSKPKSTTGDVNVAGGMTAEQAKEITEKIIQDHKAEGYTVKNKPDGSTWAEFEVNGLVVRKRVK